MLRAACLACCCATGATPGQRLSVGAVQRGQVADHEQLRVSGQVELRFDRHAAGAIERDAERTRQRRGRDAGRPDHRARVEPRVAHRDAAIVDGGDARVGPHLDAEPLERTARGLPQVFGERREDVGPASTSTIRAVAVEIVRKSWPSVWRAISASAPASSTPVGPPPTMTNVSSRRRRSGSSSRSAVSNASSTRRRISSASSSVLSPGATPPTPGGRSTRASRRSRRSGSRTRSSRRRASTVPGRRHRSRCASASSTATFC